MQTKRVLALGFFDGVHIGHGALLRRTRQVADRLGCTAAVLKERSPSCGCGRVYDGTFTGTLTEGDGVTAEVLKARGIRVYGESEIEKVL